MKSFLIPQKYQWVLANCQGSLMIRLGGEGGGNLAVNQHSIQEGEVKLRVASCLGLLLVLLTIKLLGVCASICFGRLCICS